MILYSASKRDLALEGSQGGNGTAADVQAHAAPADGRPIDDPNLRRLGPAALCRMEQLPQRLHSIENARCRLAHNGGFVGSDHQDVTFLVGLRQGVATPTFPEFACRPRYRHAPGQCAKSPSPCRPPRRPANSGLPERSDAAKRSSSVLLVTSMLTRVPTWNTPWPSSS